MDGNHHRTGILAKRRMKRINGNSAQNMRTVGPTFGIRYCPQIRSFSRNESRSDSFMSQECGRRHTPQRWFFGIASGCDVAACHTGLTHRILLEQITFLHSHREHRVHRESNQCSHPRLSLCVLGDLCDFVFKEIAREPAATNASLCSISQHERYSSNNRSAASLLRSAATSSPPRMEC
jgi:hypothetical protein